MTRVLWTLRRGVTGLASLLAVVVALATSTQPAWAQTPRQMQWWLDALGVPAAMGVATGRNVTVAMLDTGVDGSSPEFNNRLMPGVDLDNSQDSPHIDTDGHGTAMAGIVAASGADGRPMGIAPEATILPIRVAKSRDADADFTIPMGIKYAVDHGSKVINISWGGPGEAPTDMKQALRYAFQHDVVVIAAAGNTEHGDRGIVVPANYPGVVAVTGTSKSGNFWNGSIQGAGAVLSAPAEEIVSTPSTQVNNAAYSVSNGTSCSAAIISGVAALIRSKYPDLNAPSVINRLIKTADDRGSVGRDPQYGFGVVDPGKALTAEVNPVERNPLVAPTGSASATETDVASSRAAASARGASDGLLVAVVLIVLAVVLAGAVVGLVLWRRRRRENWSLARGSPVASGLLGEAPRNGAGEAAHGRSPGPGEGVGGR